MPEATSVHVVRRATPAMIAAGAQPTVHVIQSVKVPATFLFEGLYAVVDDPSPALGGNLDLNGFTILGLEAAGVGFTPGGTITSDNVQAALIEHDAEQANVHGIVDASTLLYDSDIGSTVAAEPSGTPDGTKFYRDDGTWQTPPTGGGGGDVATDAIWDAKGDLVAGTGSNTASRVAVGTDGQFLKADSAASAGVSWGTIAGGGDLLSTNNLSDVADPATARTNLGLGYAITEWAGNGGPLTITTERVVHQTDTLSGNALAYLPVASTVPDGYTVGVLDRSGSVSAATPYIAITTQGADTLVGGGGFDLSLIQIPYGSKVFEAHPSENMWVVQHSSPFGFDTTATLGTSDALIPTQHAVKTYVDTNITALPDLAGGTDINVPAPAGGVITVDLIDQDKYLLGIQGAALRAAYR